MREDGWSGWWWWCAACVCLICLLQKQALFSFSSLIPCVSLVLQSEVKRGATPHNAPPTHYLLRPHPHHRRHRRCRRPSISSPVASDPSADLTPAQ